MSRILIVVLSLVMFSGCGLVAGSTAIDEIKEMCKQNGGLKYLRVYTGSVKGVCSNGVTTPNIRSSGVTQSNKD